MKRTSLHTLGAVACAAVMAVSLVGCGSSGGSTKGSSTLSDADFKTQANAICKTANADIATINTKVGAATDDAATTAAFGEFTDRVTKLVTDLKALKVPADLKDDVTSMLDTVSGVVSTAKTQGPTFLEGATDPFADADTKAVALGLNECAGNQNDASPSAGSSSLSAEEFKTQANAICKAAGTQMDALNPGTKPTDAQLDTAYSALADIILAEVDQLKALTAPAELKSGVDALLTSVTAAATEVKTKGHAIAQDATSPFDDANSKATTLGLTDCVR